MGEVIRLKKRIRANTAQFGRKTEARILMFTGVRYQRRPGEQPPGAGPEPGVFPAKAGTAFAVRKRDKPKT